MKTFLKKSLVVAAILSAVSIAGMMPAHAQETTASTASIVPHSGAALRSVESYSDAQLQQLISDLSATPLIWPTNLPDNSVGSKYWSLAHPNWPPLPTAGNTPFWNLSPAYSASPMSYSAMSSDSTETTGSGFYLLDDVDFPPSPGTNSDGGTNIYTFQPMGLMIDTNGLYLEVPTNAYSATSNYFNVLIHNTTNGDFYDVLSKTDLLLPAWTVEETVTGAVGNVTPVTLNLNGRTNLFVWARTAAITINTQPLTQEVVAGDSVTFSVAVEGSDLSYQWTFDGTNIYGATGSSYTINNVNAAEAGDYACIVTSSAGTVTSQTATLTVDNGSGDPYLTQPIGQRQDYVFRSGVTYKVASSVQLYGNTTFEPGTIIKFDYTQTDPTLQIMGTVTCKGTAYNPSILTTIDDNSYGEQLNSNSPQPHANGVPYLDLSLTTGDLSLTNVWFRYADEAVSTPANGRLDVWNGQFFQCNAAILNESNGVDSLHNVLLAGCGVAVAADTNAFAITAENVTADVTNLYTASVSPAYVVLTNSIVTGNANGASLQNSAVAPAPSNFQTNGAGNYYLAASSALHQAGTTNISPYLLDEFHNKTTYAPIALPEFMSLSGNLTLSAQVPRYTNGAPDIGYYYDALDYTVAGITNFGSITVLPGTAIGFREDLNTATWWGFTLREESSFVSHGTPTKPIIFADVQWVQEQYADPCYSLFVPNFEGATNDAAPVLDFRFCNFYPAGNWYEVWAGQDQNNDFMASYDSVVNWTMRDCNLFDGWINLGEPDNGSFYNIPYNTFYGVGSVTWDNNLFENELINLQPSYYWYDGTINVDMAFSARNNLFHSEGNDFVIASQTSSSGNWLFEDNLFDKVNFFQNTALPLDYDYNGYWPLAAAELQSGYTNQFQVTTTGDGFTDGGHEQVLSYAPPYVAGAFGDYYLSSLTALYEAGSQTAGAAGLAQYTVFANQSKDASNAPVSIGLHYVAAMNNAPLDSDSDGIPDYVETEYGTDPNNAMTDGVTNDIYNAAYDDVDLSGDGLVGRVKAALGLNPLDPSNPLTLKQVITGQEPDVVTFEVPISYNTLTNIGGLNLNFNGADVTLEDCVAATNGNCLLRWNTDYDSPGQSYLQPVFSINQVSDEKVNYSGVGYGTIYSFNSTNVAQFYEGHSRFDNSGAMLYATTPTCPDASYTIELRDPNNPTNSHIKTITGTTSTGVIQTNWDLTYDDGVTLFTGNKVEAVFNVTLLDPGSAIQIQTLNFWSYPGDGNFDVAYAYNCSPSFLQQYGAFWNQMAGVVDALLTPVEAGGGSFDNYNSTFNRYDGQDFAGQLAIPGYIPDRSTMTNLLNDLANPNTENFYYYGHGADWAIAGNTSLSNPSTPYLYASEVAKRLTNSVSVNGGVVAKHPYRFVFLDACSTAKTKEWQHAFGIVDGPPGPGPYTDPDPPRAFLGWEDEKVGLGAETATETTCTDYGTTVNEFYDCWMSGFTLDECIKICSVNYSSPTYTVQDSSGLHLPFPIPGNEHCILSDGSHFNRTGGCPHLKLVGYRGLTRSGYDPSYPTGVTEY